VQGFRRWVEAVVEFGVDVGMVMQLAALGVIGDVS
jgi:hypothetical protein